MLALLTQAILTNETTAETITFDEVPSEPAAQTSTPPLLYWESAKVNEAYASRGVHFTFSPDIYYFNGYKDISIYGGDIFSVTTYLDFAFNEPQPTSQYLGLTKNRNLEESLYTLGIVIEFDHLCRHLSFETRRPGEKAANTTTIFLSFDNTETGEYYLFTPTAISYNVASTHGIDDTDSWIKYSWDASSGLPAFNRVWLIAGTKFAIDNLTFYDYWDVEEDNDVDGKDLAILAESGTMPPSEIEQIADRFGITEY